MNDGIDGWQMASNLVFASTDSSPFLSSHKQHPFKQENGDMLKLFTASKHSPVDALLLKKLVSFFQCIRGYEARPIFFAPAST